MVVVRLSVDLPTIRVALNAAPAMSLRHEDTRGTGSETHALLWATGVGDEVADAALAEDPSVSNAERLATIESRHLYRVKFADKESSWPALYDRVIDVDGIVVDASGTAEGWTIRLFFPDRDALSAFYDYCRSVDLVPQIQSVSMHDSERPDNDYGLTPPQREVLVTASESGYFAVPKEVSLSDLADQLGISDQAVSERLRRGMHTLVESTLGEHASLRHERPADR